MNITEMKEQGISTDNDFEILVTPRTLNMGLITVNVEHIDDQTRFMFCGMSGSDFIVHILKGDDPETYIHIKSGSVVAARPFMYTKRYLKCRIGRSGKLQAVV